MGMLGFIYMDIRLTELQLCPCCSQKLYADCCEPYHEQQAFAPTAEALMRSRFSAFCVRNIDYLVATHHPTKRAFDERMNLKQTLKTTTWAHLIILETKQGRPSDTNGIVEFVAVHSAPQWGQLHERSKFVQVAGQWFYVDGTLLPPFQPKPYAACWCGSGKKFKHCHQPLRE
jgi:SEC-C motif domain protein